MIVKFESGGLFFFSVTFVWLKFTFTSFLKCNRMNSALDSVRTLHLFLSGR